MADARRTPRPAAKEMAPTKTGAKDGEENSPRSRVVKNLSLRGGGPPAEAAASSAPNYGSRDRSYSADSTPSGKEMAPTNTGAEHW